MSHTHRTYHFQISWYIGGVAYYKNVAPVLKQPKLVFRLLIVIVSLFKFTIFGEQVNVMKNQHLTRFSKSLQM